MPAGKRRVRARLVRQYIRTDWRVGKHPGFRVPRHRAAADRTRAVAEPGGRSELRVNGRNHLPVPPVPGRR